MRSPPLLSPRALGGALALALVAGCGARATSDAKPWERRAAAGDEEARASDVGSPSAIEVCDGVSALIEAEDREQVLWERGWGVASGAVLHGQEGLESFASEPTLELRFVGTSLRSYHRTGPNTHEYLVSVDDRPPVTVTTTEPGFRYQIEAVIATDLPPGPHTARLVCTRPYCQIDFFRVGCGD